MKRLLWVDGVINILLGLLLLSYWEPVIRAVGIPYVAQPFYARILGAVLFGIGLALLIQTRKAGAGLGLAGAIAINLSGGVCLGVLLFNGRLNVPVYGEIIMWALVILLLGLSVLELLSLKLKSAD